MSSSSSSSGGMSMSAGGGAAGGGAAAAGGASKFLDACGLNALNAEYLTTNDTATSSWYEMTA